MNLYNVGDCQYEWSCFCFAPTANTAKVMVSSFFGSEYIDMRCRTCRKGVNVPYAAVVDDAEHELYPRVVECGFRYQTLEEMFAGDCFF